MMVAKRQRKGKVHKNGTKENPWTRVRTSGETKHATFLASPICIGQAQGGGDKMYKKRKPRWMEALPLGSACPHASRVYFPLLGQIKLSCNSGTPFQIFAMARQNRGNYTLPQHICCHDLDVTWMKQHQLSPSKAETKPNRSPILQKLTLWKLNAKETQHSGSDKKPSMLTLG